MNAKTLLLILSIALNLLLAAALLRKAPTPPAPDMAEAPATPGPTSAAAKAEPAPVTTTVTNLIARKFNWQAVESADYKEYIANLKSIGCPDETIRDIILADVNKLYAQKKKEVRGEPKKFEYWKAGNPFLGGMAGENLEKYRILDKERDDLLLALGITPDAKSAMATLMDNSIDAMFGFLPEDKRTKVIQLMNDMQMKMAKASKDGRPDGEDYAKSQKEMEAAIAKLLTPQELLDYNLRISMTANLMRNNIAGWDPDEQEYLKVFNLRKAFDDEFSPMSRANESKEERTRREAAEKDLKAAIKQSLGDDRYTAYERGQDWAFQQINRAVKKAELDDTTAIKVYDMKKAAEAQATQLRGNAELNGEARNAALKGIREETEISMKRLLGEKGWEQLQRGNGMYWLNNISRQPKATAPAAIPAK